MAWMGGIDRGTTIVLNCGMNVKRGLRQLYDRFGGSEFTGVPLRQVMIAAAATASGGNPGWQASIALSRLVRSGMVDLVRRDDDAKASWGHTYQISHRGFQSLGVEVPEEQLPDHMPSVQTLRKLIPRVMESRAGRVAVKSLNDEKMREALRFGVAAGWLRISVEVTDEGRTWFNENEGNFES